MAHQAGAYPGFSSRKQPGVFLLPPQTAIAGLPWAAFAGTHLYTWVERGTVRAKCLAQGHNTMSQICPEMQVTEMHALYDKHHKVSPFL